MFCTLPDEFFNKFQAFLDNEDFRMSPDEALRFSSEAKCIAECRHDKRESDLYSCTIQYSTEDRAYIARSSEFPFVSAFGDTRLDAVREFEIALKLIIEGYKESSEELPPPKFLRKD